MPWPDTNFHIRNRQFALIFMLLMSIIGWYTFMLFLIEEDIAFGNWLKLFDRDRVSPSQYWGLAMGILITLMAFWKSCWVFPAKFSASAADSTEV